ncbi:MAG: hypothetical protein ISP01_04355 [Methanobrevibacter arboriphilus]|uniref:Uncharacterized protein n=1 Tax=Methanobrevibacter arboriphilus TaxID=39441 RepID=A0A843AHP5_METAZ|nr:hypothetical protein [Methanobrevibacter arboriphilus]MBF4468615.1 hypothetical protein [Methanobrevibacter arboriphilus]
MKAKINLPNKNLSEENKKLKKIIKLLIKTYKIQKEKIKVQEEIINVSEKLEKRIAEVLAENDIHYIGINDEEFQKYQKKRYSR